MANGVRRFISSVTGIIIADTFLRYVAPYVGIYVPVTSSGLTFIVVGAVFTALVADVVYKKSYGTPEEEYMRESEFISE